MKCVLCGRENPDDALYCGGCGWPQKKQKGGRGWLVAVLGIVAVLLIAAAVFIFFRPAPPEPVEPLAPYELVAQTFVETYWNNDMPTMETVVEYHYFSYLEDELDTGRPVACEAVAERSVPCDDGTVLDVEMALSFIGGYDTVTEAYDVTVRYTADGQPGSTDVTVGKIGDRWVVVKYRPFYAD